ncbi:hypothetical protein [uncultured Pseudodesulfovibrio sp.]|nr:hypothetical protein [uncultured Pseudodesulfovibrio sp.]
MYELVVEHNGRELVVFIGEDKRVVELVRQRHARSLTPGEATIREAKKK